MKLCKFNDRHSASLHILQAEICTCRNIFAISCCFHKYACNIVRVGGLNLCPAFSEYCTYPFSTKKKRFLLRMTLMNKESGECGIMNVGIRYLLQQYNTSIVGNIMSTRNIFFNPNDGYWNFLFIILRNLIIGKF